MTPRRLLHRCRALLAAIASSVALGLAPGPVAAQQARAWQPIGPDHGTTLVAAHNPADGAVVLAGTYFGGLYRSTNWGFHWTAVDVPFAASSVFALHWDASQAGRVYAGLFQGGVWRSNDAGVSWADSSGGMAGATVQAVASSPAIAQLVLAATTAGLYRSTDAGASWAPVPGLAGASARALAFAPGSATIAYAGVTGRGVFRTNDAGQTWTALEGGSDLLLVNAVAVDAAGHLYAATDAGVFQWPAGGGAWTNLNFNLPSGRSISSVLPHPSVPQLLMATTDVGVYVIGNWTTNPSWYRWTTDSARFIVADRQGLILHVAQTIGSMKATVDFGGSWARADYGIQTAFVGGIASTVAGGAWRLLAGSDLGVSSLQPPAAWQSVLPLQEGVFDIQVRAGVAYAGSETNGVYKSTDLGTTWQAASNGIVPTRVAGLAFTSGSAPTLLAATGSGAHRSTDGGRSWQPVRLASVSFVHAVAPDPVRPPIVWLSSGGGRVLRSLDHGVNFSDAGNGLPAEDIVKLVHAPWSSVYALTASGRLYSTINDGVSWFPTAPPCTSSPGVALQVDGSRPWILYLATATGGVCKSESGGLSWTSASTGMPAQPWLATLLINPGDPRQLWAGSVGQIYRSNDAGANWQALSSGLPAGAPISVLVLDPANAQHLYAVVYGRGLYESADAGSTWSLASSDAAAASALALVADPAQGGRLLVGTPHLGARASNDSGGTWTASSDGMSLFVRSIASDPADPNTLFAGTLGGGVFRSQNAAASWSSVGLASGNVFRVRSPAAGRVLVGSSNGAAESLDGGGSWADLGQRLAYVQSLAADPADPRRVLLGTVGGDMRVGDAGGARWRAAGATLPRRNLLAMATCPDGTVLVAPENSGVWKASFSNLDGFADPGSAGLGTTQLVALACDPRSGFYYAASNGQGVWLSTSAGAGWSAINQGLPANAVLSAVVPSPVQAWQVWAAVRNGTVYRSDNAGLAWTAAGTGLPTGGISHLVGAADGTMYAGTAGGVFKRPPAAGTWAAVGPGLPAGTITALWADPGQANVLMAAVSSQGVYRSGNAGASWARAQTDAASADVVGLAGTGGVANARVHAATAGTGVATSLDGGASFGAVQVAAAMPLVVMDIGWDGVDAATLYLASGGQGVLVSRDGGAHWRLANQGLGNLELLCLVAHPTRTGELYVGGHGGVHVSRDFGASWSALNTGLVNKNVTALHFDTVAPDTLYAGIEGGGIRYLDTRP